MHNQREKETDASKRLNYVGIHLNFAANEVNLSLAFRFYLPSFSCGEQGKKNQNQSKINAKGCYEKKPKWQSAANREAETMDGLLKSLLLTKRKNA